MPRKTINHYKKLLLPIKYLEKKLGIIPFTMLTILVNFLSLN